MGKTRIHFRLSDANYDFLCEVSRQHLDVGLNKALNACLDHLRGMLSECGPRGISVGHVASKLDRPVPKS